LMAPLSRKRASVYACCALFVWVANQGEVATGLPLKEGAAGSLNSGLYEFVDLPAGNSAAIAAAEKAAIIVAKQQAAELQAKGGKFVDKQNKVAQHLAKATIASKSAARPPVPAAKPLTPVEKAEQSAAAAQKKANHLAVKATAAVQPPTQVAAPAKAPSAPAVKDEIRQDGTIVQHIAKKELKRAGSNSAAIAAAERAASIVAKQLKTASAKKASAENKSPASTKKKATPPAVIKKVSVAKKAAVKKKVSVAKKVAPPSVKKKAPAATKKKATPPAVKKKVSVVKKVAPPTVKKKAPAATKSPAAKKKKTRVEKKAAPPVVRQKAAVAKKAPVSAPSKSTEKVWADMASDAEVTASASEFYAKHLNSMTKVEASFSGLLDQEKKSAVAAAKLSSTVKDLQGTFDQKPKTKKTTPTEYGDLGESDELLTAPMPADMAAKAEAAAKKIVAKEHLSAKPAQQSPAPQKVEETPKQKAEERLAHDEKEVQVMKPKKKARKGVAEARPASADEAQQARAAQALQASELSKAAKVAKKGEATEKQLKAEQAKVAALEAEKKKENAEASQKAKQALSSEIDTHNKLSAALQSVSDSAHTNEVMQAHLFEKAQDIRSMATLNTNLAEQELDALSQHTDATKHSERLGESQAPKGGFTQAVVNYEHAMTVHKSQVGSIVKMGQRIGVDAAKVQEDQQQATEASSKIAAGAQMLSQRLKIAGQRIAKMKKQTTSTAELKKELKRLKTADKKTMKDVVHLAGAATNAASDEAAGVKATQDEVGEGAKMLKSIATDLMPHA